MIKRFFSLLICSLFLFNISGYYIVFSILQHQVRKEMKALIKSELPDEKMEIIIIPDSEILSGKSTLTFIKKNEFYYKGNLYDIVKRTRGENSSIFYCINDKQEEKLFAGLDDHIRSNMDKNTNAKSKSVQIAKNIIKEALPESKKPISSITFREYYYRTFTSFVIWQYSQVDSPPPKA